MTLILYSYPTNINRFSQIGVFSYGSECPSHGVYARVTEAKHWIQYITEGEGAVDSNCIDEVPFYPGKLCGKKIEDLTLGPKDNSTQLFQQ